MLIKLLTPSFLCSLKARLRGGGLQLIDPNIHCIHRRIICVDDWPQGLHIRQRGTVRPIQCNRLRWAVLSPPDERQAFLKKRGVLLLPSTHRC